MRSRPRARRRPRESECFTIGLTEQKNCRTNGGLCRYRTPMHRGRARRRGRERFPNFGIWDYSYQTTANVWSFFDEDVNINPFMGSGAVGTMIDDFRNQQGNGARLCFRLHALSECLPNYLDESGHHLPGLIPVVNQGSFHEGLVVLLGDFLVGDPDVTIHHFRVGFVLGHEVGSIDGLLALGNGILVDGVVHFTFLH